METLIPPPVDDLTLDDLARVHSIVRQHLPPSYDREDIAVDILIESWTNHQPRPSWGFIRNRCIDMRRSHNKELGLIHDKSTHSPATQPPGHDAQEIATLVRVLDPWERKLIYYRFYQDLPLPEIAKRLSCSLDRVRNTLSAALYKMKEEAC